MTLVGLSEAHHGLAKHERQIFTVGVVSRRKSVMAPPITGLDPVALWIFISTPITTLTIVAIVGAFSSPKFAPKIRLVPFQSMPGIQERNEKPIELHRVQVQPKNPPVRGDDHNVVFVMGEIKSGRCFCRTDMIALPSSDTRSFRVVSSSSFRSSFRVVSASSVAFIYSGRRKEPAVAHKLGAPR